MVSINSGRSLAQAANWFSNIAPLDASKPIVEAPKAAPGPSHSQSSAQSATASASASASHNEEDATTGPQSRSLFSTYDPAAAQARHLQAMQELFAKYREVTTSPPEVKTHTNARSGVEDKTHSDHSSQSKSKDHAEPARDLLESPLKDNDGRTFRSVMSKTAREAMEKVCFVMSLNCSW
jgi:hypothetical protein